MNKVASQPLSRTAQRAAQAVTDGRTLVEGQGFVGSNYDPNGPTAPVDAHPHRHHLTNTIAHVGKQLARSYGCCLPDDED